MLTVSILRIAEAALLFSCISDLSYAIAPKCRNFVAFTSNSVLRNFLLYSVDHRSQSVSEVSLKNESELQPPSEQEDQLILNEVSAFVNNDLRSKSVSDAPEFPRGISLNNTQLSLKVEAEMLNQYDELVPGPVPGQRGRPLLINLDLLSYMAREAMKEGDIAESLRIYRRCVELDPRDGRGWMGLARHESKSGNYAKARSLWDMGIAHSPDNPFLLQAYGVMEEKLGNFQRALELYVTATRADPRHAASWVALAMLYRRKNRISEARRCLEAATRANPSGYYAWQAWGVLEESQGDYELAREKFKRSACENSRNAALYQAWGVMEGRLGNYQSARELFQRGLKENPKSSFIMQAWAVMEARCGHLYQAEKLFKEAILIQPRDAAIYQAYSLVLKSMRNIKGARALLQKAIKIDRKHAPSWQVLAVLEAELGNISIARDVFQQGIWACVSRQQKVRLFQSWGVVESRLRNYNEARRCFRFGLEQDGSSIPVLVAWALMEEEAGFPSRSRELFEVAVSIKSSGISNVNIWNAYEAMERRCGNKNEARDVYERGVAACTPRLPQTIQKFSSNKLDTVKSSFGSELSSKAAEIDELFTSSFGSETLGKMVWTNDYMSFHYVSLGNI